MTFDSSHCMAVPCGVCVEEYGVLQHCLCTSRDYLCSWLVWMEHCAGQDDHAYGPRKGGPCCPMNRTENLLMYHDMFSLHQQVDSRSPWDDRKTTAAWKLL